MSMHDGYMASTSSCSWNWGPHMGEVCIGGVLNEGAARFSPLNHLFQGGGHPNRERTTKLKSKKNTLLSVPAWIAAPSV
jgi:hypothetical protein